MPLPVLISYANMGYIVFAKNLLLNLNATCHGYSVHFYCLDIDIKSILERLTLSNITVRFELVEATVSKNFEKYGTNEYNKITHTKMNILMKSLETYGFIHFIDCDVVCISPPTESYWDRYTDKDIVFQYDAGFYSKDNPHWPLHHIWACTGNITLRNTFGTIHMLTKIIEYQEQYPGKNDQECLYQYFKDNNITDIRLCEAAKLDTYPYQEFTNGYWVGHDIGGIEKTYFFHANHVSGSSAKMNLLKKVGKWYL